jgi:hypothetical protein
MNPDVTYASCDAPQEKTDKEVELDEDGNEVRKEKKKGDCFSSFGFDVNVFFASSFSLANEFDYCFRCFGDLVLI